MLWNDRQTAPCAMQLADAVNLHDDSFYNKAQIYTYFQQSQMEDYFINNITKPPSPEYSLRRVALCYGPRAN